MKKAKVSKLAPPKRPGSHTWNGGNRCVVCGLNREKAGNGPLMQYRREGKKGTATRAGACKRERSEPAERRGSGRASEPRGSRPPRKKS